MPLDDSVRQKIALFCNVGVSCVIQNLDVDSVYQLPMMLEEEGLARVICDKLKLPQKTPDLSDWQLLVLKHRACMRRLTVALVGKYTALQDAYLSVLEALKHSGIEKGCEIDIRWVATEKIEQQGAEAWLDGADAIIVPGGFGPRGMNGMIAAAGYARMNRIPFLGIGMGMQMAVVEFARNVAGLHDAHSEEAESGSLRIFVLPENGFVSRSAADKPMRRGACNCVIMDGSQLARAYGRSIISERHHHRWEFCNDFREQLTDAGLVISGTSPDGSLVEAVELQDHPWFIGVQYHPEFKSRPTRPHPLFNAFIDAALSGIQSAGQKT